MTTPGVEHNNGTFVAQYRHQYLGRYPTEEAAIIAHDTAALLFDDHPSCIDKQHTIPSLLHHPVFIATHHLLTAPTPSVHNHPPNTPNTHVPFNVNPYYVHTIDGDGNCFFRAIAFILYGTEDNHLLIRHLVADYVATKWTTQCSNGIGTTYRKAVLDQHSLHGLIIPNGTSSERESLIYHTFMTRNKTWAGAPEIEAASYKFNIHIQIYYPCHEDVMVRHNVHAIDNVILQHVEGNHFHCLLRYDTPFVPLYTQRAASMTTDNADLLTNDTSRQPTTQQTTQINHAATIHDNILITTSAPTSATTPPQPIHRIPIQPNKHLHRITEHTPSPAMMETTSNIPDVHTSTESFINQPFVGIQTINGRHTINLI
jgi:hypothetical protein